MRYSYVLTQMNSTSNIFQRFSPFVGGCLKSLMLSSLCDQFHSLKKVHAARSKYLSFHNVHANRLSFSFLLFFPQDQHLHNFFQYCQKTESGAQALGNELVKYLKVSDGFLSNPFIMSVE